MSSRQILPKCGQQQQTPASAIEIEREQTLVALAAVIERFVVPRRYKRR
jgi:hypothetical protein